MLSREATTLPSFRVEINSQDKGNELRNRAAMGGIGRGSKGNFSQRLPPLSLFLRDIFGSALHPLIRKKSSRRGSPLMVVPRCHGYLHASGI